MTDPNPIAPEQEPFVLDEDKTTARQVMTENERLLAGSSYLSQLIVPAVLPIILLVADDTKQSKFLKYHATQSLMLLVATILFYIAAGILYVLLTAIIPLLGCVAWIPFLAPAAAMIYCGVQAFRGILVEMPYLTEFGQKQGWL